MITVEIHGRLGNHLFQYAFAYTISRQLNTQFQFKFIYRSEIDSIFEIPSYKKPWYYKCRTISKHFERLQFKIKKNPQTLISVDNFHSLKKQDNCIYRGFYQSYLFFSECEKEIRREFKIKDKHLNAFDKKYSELFKDKQILAVHIRRGDYLNVDLPELGNLDVSLPISYFKRNIEKLRSQDTMVYFATDDVAFVKEQFGEGENFVYSNGNMVHDFIALTKAEKVIISNSSFSWWATFLNENKNKEVIAPKYYLGFKVNKEIPEDIMYQGFNWVNVF